MVSNKKYIRPQVLVIHVAANSILAGSLVFTDQEATMDCGMEVRMESFSDWEEDKFFENNENEILL